MIIFAGGIKDPLREAWLGQSVSKTGSKTYSTVIWKKKEESDLLQVKDFRGNIPESVMTQYINLSSLSGYQNLKFATSDIRNHFENFENYLKKTTRQMQTRQFEDANEIYIAVETPEEILNFRRYLQTLNIPSNFIKDFDNQINLAITKIFIDVTDHNIEELTFDEQNSMTFAVEQRACPQPVRTINNTFFTVAGDGLATPHFYSGSGLSTGRKACQDIASVTKEYHLRRYFDENKLSDAHFATEKFVLERGKPYLLPV